jgi:hypothetical protein
MTYRNRPKCSALSLDSHATFEIMRLLQTLPMLVLMLAMASAGTAQPVVHQADWTILSATPSSALAAESERLDGEVARLDAQMNTDRLAAGLASRGDRIAVSLPAGDVVYRVTRVESYLPGITSIAALAEDGSGDMVAISVGPDGAIGSVHAAGDLYFLVEDADGQSRLVMVDGSAHDHLECGNSEHEHADRAPLSSAGASLHALAPAGTDVHMRAMADAADVPVTIDLMIAYTALADAWASNSTFGSINTIIAQAMTRSQLALDNSEVNITLRLVHAFEIDYDETLGPPVGSNLGASSWHLRRLTAGPDYNPWGADAEGYMEEVHPLRAQYGADLVTLFADVSDVGGIAWLLNNVGGRPEIGFSVNRVRQMASSYTLIHEIGHNMGSAHGRDQPSNAAGPGGGLFPHSTGWRWTGNSGSSQNSVMSYGQPGDIRAPYFSNPDILVDGVPSGEYIGPYAPADNARSLRETKLSVSSYQPTVVDPPAAVVTVPDLSVTVPIDGVATRTVSISNTGLSDLTWRADLALPSQSQVQSGLWAGGATLHASLDADVIGSHAVNTSPIEAARATDETIIYQTSFEGAQGFSTGLHGVIEGWSTSSAAIPMRITTENPSDGARHLRLPANTPVSATANFYSPYFGPWPTGSYEFSLDVSISATGGSTYFLIFTDGITGARVAGVAYSNTGSLFAYNPASGNYTSTGATFTPGVYERLTMSIDPNEAQVRYLLDQQEIAVRPIVDAASIGRLWIQRSNVSGNDFIDIDNISYTSAFQGFAWAELDAYAGTVVTGGEQVVTLAFDASGVDEGVYSAELVVRSNDPVTPEQRIPVIVNVTGQVTTDPGAEALATRLVGSFPNPARSQATVQFVLAEQGSVQIEVISVTGQRVATLVDGLTPAGHHDVALDTSGLASGVYLLRFRSGDVAETGRILVIR